MSLARNATHEAVFRRAGPPPIPVRRRRRAPSAVTSRTDPTAADRTNPDWSFDEVP